MNGKRAQRRTSGQQVDTEIDDRREGKRVRRENAVVVFTCFLSFFFCFFSFFFFSFSVRDTLYVRIYVSRVLEVSSFVRS